MAIGNEQLMRKWFQKHSRIGTTRIKLDNETKEEGKNRVSMERNKASTKNPKQWMNYQTNLHQ